MLSILNKLLIICILFTFTTCSLIDKKEEIPSYIQIDSIKFYTTPKEGDSINDFCDVWVYVDDKHIGTFELPAKFPVLADGKHKISITGGIKLNGIAATRSAYPFLEPYITYETLHKGNIIRITPIYKYSSNITFCFFENFENSGLIFETNTTSDTCLLKVPDNTFKGMYAGKIVLDNNKTSFEAHTIEAYKLPKMAEPVFLEMVFKTNQEVEIGLYANNTSNASVEKLPIMYLNPTKVWKKIYINLTPTVARNNSAEDFRIYFRIEKPTSLETGETMLDNIKLLHL